MRRLTYLAFVFWIFAAPVFAQTANQCGPRAAVVDDLERRFGESQQAAGIVSERQVLEVWSNTDTGTWTALVSDHIGGTCIVASGQSWSLAPAPPTPQGTDG